MNPQIDFYYIQRESGDRLHEYSRFRRTPLAVIGGVKSFASWRPPTIPTSALDDVFRVTPGEDSRIDLVSKSVYGTMRLFWVIMLLNNILEPFTVVSDRNLRTPRLTNIVGAL